jgi:hypothetical protein
MLNTDYWETIKRRQKFLNEKWLEKDKEIDYKEIIIYTNKDQIRNLNRYTKSSINGTTG